MIRSLKKIFNFCGDNKKTFLKSLIFTLLKHCFGIIQICGIIILMDALMNDAPKDITIIKLATLTLICMIGSFATAYAEQVAILTTDFKMVEDKRIGIGNILKRVPLGIFSGNKAENISATLTSTLSSVELSAAYTISGILGGFISTAVTLTMLVFYDLRIAGIASAGMLAYYGVISWQMRVSKKNVPAQHEAMNRLIRATITFVQGIKVTKAFNVQDGDKSIREGIEASCKANRRLTDVAMPSQFAGNICIALFEILIIIADLLLYMKFGSISVDKAIVILVISFFVFSSMNQAGISLSMIGLLETAIDEVNELENTEQLAIMQPEGHMKDQEIVFRDVHFSYDDNEVLHDINLDIKPHTTTAIIGPSGSGKSTLCQLIARFWDVDSGSISIGGTDIRHIDDTELMANISMVFQKVYLFEDTIENNIRIGRPDASHEEIVAAATAASCDEFISQLPEGYDTVVAEGGGSLSGGEKQRISIARAMLKDAPIVILDEATNALDAENEKSVIEAVSRLTRNKTVIMIAHRMKTVRSADKILALEKGRIVQEGAHEQLIKESGLYRRFISNREKAREWTIR
ncbi:ABC transporter ATP-binding protein [Pseudoramibacter alactolyticus]|uniref:ABC transporter ATP-binding protein n=1 Tax=Pseudoramibacter alactolyticus TaxID=113287 RepID=UPI00248E166E|nr:ABC transporter ATP-binding protein [Pseudoramibacter alactolyticus]